MHNFYQILAMLRHYFFLPALLFALPTIYAQLPDDALMMTKGQWCILTQYTHNSWTNYWEGPTRRSNLNLGVVTTQSAMLGFDYGISRRLNVLGALPYVWTHSSASYLQGQRGLQDFSLWLKYQPFEANVAGGEVRLQATGGLSTPVSNYVADFMPLAIGLGSRTASLRGIVNFTHAKGLYVTLQAGHTWRSDITTDRDAFMYNNQLYYTNRMPVPNLFDASGRLGFINARLQAEVQMSYFTGTSGDDIRYNEMPQPTNRMRATTVGLYAKYFVWQRLALQAAYGQVLNGRNVGQGTTLSGGISYLIGTSRR
ncbi:MAG: hypothetical protein RMJ33_00995 [Saprospiraceae bacterium]|nr:hypothetical protein [Saprospiraceae bacterium]MDW8228385.1 hypothetical protein [Saprospiraceae bacterium]